MTFKTTILTLFPDAFPGVLGASIIGRGLETGAWSLETVHLRQFGEGKHKNVDDTPAGGGPGGFRTISKFSGTVTVHRRSPVCNLMVH